MPPSSMRQCFRTEAHAARYTRPLVGTYAERQKTVFGAPVFGAPVFGAGAGLQVVDYGVRGLAKKGTGLKEEGRRSPEPDANTAIVSRTGWVSLPRVTRSALAQLLRRAVGGAKLLG